MCHGCATTIGDPPLSRRQSLRKRETGRAVISATKPLPLPLETPLAQDQITLRTRQAVRFPLHSQSSRLASTVDHGPLNPKPPLFILFPKATLPSGLHNRRSLEISFVSGNPPRRFLQKPPEDDINIASLLPTVYDLDECDDSTLTQSCKI